MTADGVRLATWWWRVLAAVIDNLLTSTVALVIAFPVWLSMFDAMAGYFRELLAAQQSGSTPPTMTATELISTRDQLILTAVSLGVGMLYHLVFLRWRAATPGKLLLGMRVVPVDQGRFAGQLGWNTIGVRVAIWVLPGLNSYLVVVSLLDSVFPLWQPKRQALHDLAAKTQVVRPG
jgi:uncharacterized RDD family membrane protein YckC